MATMFDSAFGVSREAELDRTIENLIAKTVSGSITPEERVTYNQLVTQRSRMMSSSIFASAREHDARGRTRRR